MAIQNLGQLRAWTVTSVIGFTTIYLRIVGVALFDHLTRGAVSNEGAAGLSLLALLPALPLSLIVNWLLEAADRSSLLAPFDTGVANVAWVAFVSWSLATAQWTWAVPKLIAAVHARK
jgi:hypothetical protein